MDRERFITGINARRQKAECVEDSNEAFSVH